MKKFFVILALLFLTACSGDFQYPKAVEYARKECELRDGVAYNFVSVNGTHMFMTVGCKDGTRIEKTLPLEDQ